MAYGVQPEGFVIKDFATIRKDVEDRQLQNIDAELDVADNSPLGQVNVSVLLQTGKLWETALATYAALNSDDAVDTDLLNLCKISGTKKSEYTQTLVTAQVLLDPNKALPAGSVANLTGRPNSRFESLTEVPADPAGGTFDVVFRAMAYGPIVVPAGELDEINEAVDGWISVNNAAEHTYTGTEPERDDDLRAKRKRELAGPGASTLPAIIAHVSKVTGVVNVTGRENCLSYAVDGLPSKHMELVVRGGNSDAIARAILEKRAGGGAGTFGNTEVFEEDTYGVSQLVRYSVPTELVLYVNITVTPDTESPDGGDLWGGTASVDEIKTEIAAYGNDNPNGTDIIYDKIKAAALAVDGVYNVTACTIGFGAASGTSDLSVTSRQYTTVDIANVNVSTP